MLARTNENRLIAVLVYLALPMAWWTGKLIGPEIWTLFFGLVGLSLFLRESGGKGSRVLGACCIGFAVGIKLTAIPVFIYALGETVLARRWKRVFVLLAFVALGVLLAHPHQLRHPIWETPTTTPPRIF